MKSAPALTKSTLSWSISTSAAWQVVAEVAESKRESGKAVRDHGRERAVLNRLTAQSGDALAPYVRDLYHLIFQQSRSYQASLLDQSSPLIQSIQAACAACDGRRFPSRALIACQGTEGAYAQQACEKLFEYPDILYFDRFEGVFSAVEKGMCEYGVLPVENSTAGSVTQVYDLMERHSFHIVGARAACGWITACCAARARPAPSARSCPTSRRFASARVLQRAPGDSGHAHVQHRRGRRDRRQYRGRGRGRHRLPRLRGAVRAGNRRRGHQATSRTTPPASCASSRKPEIYPARSKDVGDVPPAHEPAR